MVISQQVIFRIRTVIVKTKYRVTHGKCCRFGSGMVIYWFGYVGSLDSNRSAGIMLSSNFPETFVRYNPEAIRNFQSSGNSEF